MQAAVARHDALVVLVTRLLALHESPASGTDAAPQAYSPPVAQQPDRLVDAVCGMTEAETAADAAYQT